MMERKVLVARGSNFEMQTNVSHIQTSYCPLERATQIPTRRIPSNNAMSFWL